MNENTKPILEDDIELIEKCKSGNRSSFNKIVLKYQKMVYNITRKILINHDDADEITQAVFIKLYKSLNQFRGESKLTTYLYRITVNMSLNHLKKINLNKSRIQKSIELENMSDNTTTYKDVELREKENFIRKSIESLPPQQRAVFILRFYENLSYDEISQILGTSVGGLKANFFHALKNLRIFFENNDYRNIF